ncbi:unnamed protein product [Linum trigynum]|uniref:Reverse transcriptase zinc-binding domain-containing protein n=1 Tax=Linum trigynum TaxID=586398 RepID=A0AAV2DVJ4_9ROSI
MESKNLGVPNFSANSVWRKIVPAKICFFIWTVAHRKILTIDMLQKRGWSLANRCTLCCKDEESIHHLLISCSFTHHVWNLIRRRCNLNNLPISDDIAFTIKEWPLDVPKCGDGWLCYYAFHATCWFIWLERNSRIFSDIMKSPDQIARRILMNVAGWFVAKEKVDRTATAAWLRARLQLIE